MKLYGAFVGEKWGMHYNKRIAISAAKKEMKKQGTTVGEVRSMEYPSANSWDLPTFYTCSTRIWGNDATPPDVLPVAVTL